jgi:hypothetical protein
VFENDQKGLTDFLNSILQEKQETPLPEEVKRDDNNNLLKKKKIPTLLTNQISF